MDYEDYAARHPLSGGRVPAASRATKEGSPGGKQYYAEFICVLLLCCLLGAALYGREQAKTIAKLRGTLSTAVGAVVYEPLSRAGDGSYTEGPAAKSKDILGRLKGWRAKH